MVLYVLAVSIILQLAAAVIIFRLNYIIGKHPAWFLISATMIFMAVRRIFACYYIATGNMTAASDFSGEVIGSAISFLILAGFVWIAPTFFAIKRSEDKYRILVESSIVGTIIIQLGRIVFVNLIATKKLGYTRDELLALSPEGVAGLIHPEYRQTVLKNMEERLAGISDPEAYEFRVLCKDGSSLWVDIASSLIEYNGKPAVQAIMVDINYKKLAAMTLSKSEERYRILAETAHDIIFIIDRDDKIEYANSFAAAYLGLKPEQVIGQLRSKLFPAGIASKHGESLREVFETGKPVYHESSIIVLDKTMWLGTWLVALRSDGSSVDAVMGISRDITAGKQAEEVLRDSEERYRALVESSPDAIIIHSEKKFLYINPAGVKLLGAKDSSEIIGQDVMKIVPEEYNKIIEERIRKCESEQKANPTIQMKIIRFDGKLVDIDSVSAGIIYHAKPSTQMILKDITKRKKAEEILRRDKEMFEALVWKRSEELLETQMRLDRAKRLSDIGTLAATVAHELRTPLAAINLAAANIKRKAGNPALDKHLQTVEKKILESDEIINNLLFYARMKSPTYETTDIYGIVMECIDISKNKSAKKVSVKKELDALKGVSMEVDPIQIKEVFYNILSNAYDAVPDTDARIVISASVDKKSITIAIKDNGVGIDQEKQEKIFEPFYTTKPSGTGLGLTVCYQIINMHYGKINIISKMGEGTTVTVTLPISRTSP